MFSTDRISPQKDIRTAVCDQIKKGKKNYIHEDSYCGFLHFFFVLFIAWFYFSFVEIAKCVCDTYFFYVIFNANNSTNTKKIATKKNKNKNTDAKYRIYKVQVHMYK